MSDVTIPSSFPLLFTFQGTLSQAAIDLILLELDYRFTIERYVEQETGPFYIKIGGPITLSDFSLQIEDGQGLPKIKISNDFRLQFRAPIVGMGELDVPFRLSSPSIRVELFARGSKGFAIFTLSTIQVEVNPSSLRGVLGAGLAKEVWKRIKSNLGVIQTELTHAVNELLREQPFELFNLDRVEIPIGESKNLLTRIVFDEFGFREDYIAVAVRILLAQQPAVLGD